jgi:hypothetical protein
MQGVEFFLSVPTSRSGVGGSDDDHGVGRASITAGRVSAGAGRVSAPAATHGSAADGALGPLGPLGPGVAHPVAGSGALAGAPAVPRHRSGIEAQSAALVHRRPLRRTVAAVRDSWWYLGDVDLLADRLEANLIALAPGARIALLERRAAGDERLVTALLRCVDALAEAPDPVAADRQVRLLGQALNKAGLPSTDVPQVGFALVRAVRERYNGQWTTTLGSAWTAVQTWLVEQLILGARDIAPPPLVDLTQLSSPR